MSDEGSNNRTPPGLASASIGPGPDSEASSENSLPPPAVNFNIPPPNPIEEEENQDGDQLLDQEDNIQPANQDVWLSCLVYRACCKGSRKFRCCTGLTTLILVGLLTASTVGLIVMLHHEKKSALTMFTTGNETYEVYGVTEAMMMWRVCLVDQEDAENNSELILFASDCKTDDVDIREYLTKPTTLKMGDKRQYYFYLVKYSTVKLIEKNGTGIARFLYAKDPYEDILSEQLCEENGQVFKHPTQEFKEYDIGYYYVCITATTTELTYQLDVHERFYAKTKKYMCEDVMNQNKEHCCEFSFVDSFSNCVYLAAKNSTPPPLEDITPSTVHISIHYSDVFKAVVVFVVIILLLAIIITASLNCVKFEIRKGLPRAPLA